MKLRKLDIVRTVRRYVNLRRRPHRFSQWKPTKSLENTYCSVQKTYLRLLTIGLALARASAQLPDSNIPPTGRVAGGDTLSPSVL